MPINSHREMTVGRVRSMTRWSTGSSSHLHRDGIVYAGFQEINPTDLPGEDFSRQLPDRRKALPGGEDGLAIESKTLTLGAYGGDMDFYAMKGAIEAILQELRVKDVTFRIGSGLPEELSYHPGRFAEVWSGGDCLGWFGQIHPLVAKNYGVDAEFYCAELAMDELENAKGADPEYVPLPKFPAVTRDIAVVCDRAVTVGALEDCIRRGAKGLLKDVSLFDIYTGSGIPEGKKSVAFNLTLRSDDRSLTAQEADEDVKSILETLKAELNAVLR